MIYSDFKFIQPMLTKAHFDMFPVDGEPDREVSINLKKNVLHISGEKKAVLSVTVCLNQLDNDNSRKNIPFTAEVEMQSIFSWSQDLSDDEINTFLYQNATALLLSYIRPVIAILTASSPLPTYNMLFLNLTVQDD